MAHQPGHALNTIKVHVAPYNKLVDADSHSPHASHAAATSNSTATFTSYSCYNALKTLIAVSLYMTCGIALTCLNKYFLSSQYYGFEFPILLITCHMLTNTIFSFLWCYTFLEPEWGQHPLWYRNISRRTFVSKFIPVGTLFGGDIALTSIAISLVSVALVEVVKAATPAILLFLQIIRKKDEPSFMKFLIITMLTCGVALMSISDSGLGYNFSGLIAAGAALAVCSAKLFFMEVVLTKESANPASGTQQSNGTTDLEKNSEVTTLIDHTTPATQHHQHNNTRGLTPNTSYNQLDDDVGVQVATPRQRSSSLSRTPVQLPTSHLSPHISKLSSPLQHRSTDSPLSAPVLKDPPQHLTLGDSKFSDELETKKRDAIEAAKRHRRDRSSTPISDFNDASSVMVAQPFNDDNATVDIDKASSHAASIHHIDVKSKPTAHNPMRRKHDQGKIHPMLSLFYFAPVSFVVLFVLFVFNELPLLINHHTINTKETAIKTVSLITLGATMSFAFNVVELFVIQVTSALSLCVLAITKLILVIVIAGMLFPSSQHLTTLNQFGCLVSVTGVAAYNWQKYRDYVADQQDSSDQPTEGDSNYQHFVTPHVRSPQRTNGAHIAVAST